MCAIYFFDCGLPLKHPVFKCSGWNGIALCLCVCDTSDAVLKSRPQSIQQPLLHYLHNWVSSVQLLSIQWLRNWVSSPKCCQNHGMRKKREREREREREGEEILKSKWIHLPPTVATLHIYVFKMWHLRKFLTTMSEPRGSSSARRWFTVIKSEHHNQRLIPPLYAKQWLLDRL